MYLPLLFLALTLFFLLALTRPRHALVLLAALLPSYLLRFSIAGIPTNFFEVAVWLALLAVLLRPHGLQITTYGLRSLVTGYWLLITLFIIAATFSALLTPTLHSFGILKSWIITPIVFAFLIKKERARGGIYSALILSGVVVSLIGLFQLGSLDRITSIYDVPNSLALFIAPLLILAFFRGGCLSYIAALIMFVALLGTQSLAGLAAVILTLFIGLLFQRRLVTGYWLLVTMLLVASIFLTFTGRLTYFLQPLFNSSVQTSLTVRQQLWSISWELIKENPIRGIGLGQFEPAYQQQLHERFRNYGLRITDYRPLPEFIFRDPHNWILSFWLNTGLLGLLSFTALNLLALRNLFSDSPELRITSYGLLVLLIFGLFDTIYWKNDLAVLHWLLTIVSLLRIPRHHQYNPHQMARSVLAN